MCEKVLLAQERVLGRDHHHTLLTVSLLGEILSRNLDHVGAQTLLTRAVLGLERVLGEGHRSTVHSMHLLGVSLLQGGNLGKAREMLERSLQGKLNLVGPDHTVLAILLSLGDVLAATGALMDAQEKIMEAHRGYALALGADHPFTEHISQKLIALDLGEMIFQLFVVHIASDPASHPPSSS